MSSLRYNNKKGVKENKTHHQSSCRWKIWETHTRCHQKAGEGQRERGRKLLFFSFTKSREDWFEGSRGVKSVAQNGAADGQCEENTTSAAFSPIQVAFFVLRMSAVINHQWQTHNCRQFYCIEKGPSVFWYSVFHFQCLKAQLPNDGVFGLWWYSTWYYEYSVSQGQN